MSESTDREIKIIVILIVSLICLATVMFTQFTQLNYYDKFWACLGISGQCSGILGWFYGFTILSIFADNILYACVSLSILLINKLLLLYALLTLVVVYGLFYYHKICLLTNEEWSSYAKILTPIFIVILSCKVIFAS